jgi:hypothetical protein
MNHNNKEVFLDHGNIDTSCLIPEIMNSEKSNLWNDTHRSEVFYAQKMTSNMLFVWTPIIHNYKCFFTYTNDQLIKSKVGEHYSFITKRVSELIPGIILRGALIKLPPGGVIPPHVDGSHELWIHSHRIHLPIITEEEVIFFYENSKKHLEKNKLVEINNIIPHSVQHNGKNNRYHLMYDILPKSYTGDFIYQPHNSTEQFQLDKIIEKNGKGQRITL